MRVPIHYTFSQSYSPELANSYRATPYGATELAVVPMKSLAKARTARCGVVFMVLYECVWWVRGASLVLRGVFEHAA